MKFRYRKQIIDHVTLRLRFFAFSFFITLFLFGCVRQMKLATRQLLGAR